MKDFIFAGYSKHLLGSICPTVDTQHTINNLFKRIFVLGVIMLNDSGAVLTKHF